ncbi:hypothetical protein MGG_16784 [Pyricularia oryzae 70-15]|uniref:Uncharacterized protein n=2 Tax=Pyricularia oryzae TaxID=318829 RepID=G4N0W4_PYRO7|nr:uncharacterized protein MGG_16784 [Pyricularia oryzae 70-15]EHA52342.1 hypothetical protein MGG_16784 [Pyricularia oryzae 70-15]
MAKMHSASLGHQQDRRSQNKCLGTQGIFMSGQHGNAKQLGRYKGQIGQFSMLKVGWTAAAVRSKPQMASNMSNKTARKCDSLETILRLGSRFPVRAEKSCFAPIPRPPTSGGHTSGIKAAMAYKLHIPDCILEPHHPFHFPTPNKPLRIRIQGPLISIQRGFDYYGVTFNYFLPANDANPEMLHINIIELEAKYGLYANGLNYADETLLFKERLLVQSPMSGTIYKIE